MFDMNKLYAEKEDKSLYSIGLTEGEVLNLQKNFWNIINNPNKVSSNLLVDKNVKVEQIIVDYMKQYGFIRRSTIEDILGRANVILKELVSKKVLRLEEKTKTIKYYLV